MIVPYKYEEIMSINGKRDKGAEKPRSVYLQQDGAAVYRPGAAPASRTSSAPTSSAATISSASSTGTRVSLSIGVFASLIVLIIGMIYGSISGYVGGRTDLIMMRIVDIIYSLPDMLVIILISVVLDQVLDLTGSPLAKLGTNMVSIFIVFGLLYWVGMARLIRGQILSIKQNEYILAARAIGAKPGRIIKRHILPNCLSVIIISAALQVPSAIFTESYLSFLGLGVRAPMPSLGSLANAAREGLQSYPYKLVFPALTICLIVLSLNLLGDGLRDAFDPKLKR